MLFASVFSTIFQIRIVWNPGFIPSVLFPFITIDIGYLLAMPGEMDIDNITSCTLSSQLLKGRNDSRFGSLFVDECTYIRISNLVPAGRPDMTAVPSPTTL